MMQITADHELALAQRMAERWLGALRPLTQQFSSDDPFGVPMLDRKTGEPWKAPLLWPSGEPIRPMQMIELMLAPVLLLKALEWARDDVRRERAERRRHDQRRQLDLEMQAFEEARERRDKQTRAELY